MYGPDDEPRDARSLAPLGVRLVMVILLISGLALAALPISMYLRSHGAEPGHIEFVNASGARLSGVRIVHVNAAPSRLLGSRREVEVGETVDATFQAAEALELRIEFAANGVHRDLPITVNGPPPHVLRVDGDFRVSLDRPAP